MGSTRPTKCILLGLKKSVVDDTISAVESSYTAPDFEYVGCLSIEEMKTALIEQEIDHVFIGAGLDISIRLEAAKTVLENSLITQVHLKNYSAGPQGYTHFIKTILAGIKAARNGKV